MNDQVRISQLEALFERENSWDEDIEITILPNGEIQARTDKLPDVGTLKPLTFRTNLDCVKA
jgi:hypothetical protein